MTQSGITVAIPTIPPRKMLIGRALASVYAQTLPADGIAIAIDHHHEGVWVTRKRAGMMAAAASPWIAQLDDDDEFLPHHLERLAACAQETSADYVFSYFESVPPGRDTLGHFGRPFDPAAPHLTTNTVLLRSELYRQIELAPPDPSWTIAQDDQRLVDAAVALGAKIVHLPERTWRYHMHGVHSSGMPNRW